MLDACKSDEGHLSIFDDNFNVFFAELFSLHWVLLFGLSIESTNLCFWTDEKHKCFSTMHYLITVPVKKLNKSTKILCDVYISISQSEFKGTKLLQNLSDNC